MIALCLVLGLFVGFVAGDLVGTAATLKALREQGRIK